MRPQPSIGSVAIRLSVKPPEQLPAGVEFEDVVDQVVNAVRGPIERWYENDGRELLMCAPDIA